MAISFFQKVRLAIRGWSRRRDEAAERRRQEFLDRQPGWGTPAGTSVKSAGAERSEAERYDHESLQVAFLDDSGLYEHYLDLDSGEVVDCEAGGERAESLARSPRHRRIPHRSEETDRADRRVFLDSLDAPVAVRLRGALGNADEAESFRQTIAADRNVEKAWYRFKNDRTLAFVEKWLHDLQR